MALAAHVLASHYADPVERVAATASQLRVRPSEDADALAELKPGERFAAVEDSAGWAWGYAGEDRLVGYVRSDALSPARS